MSERPAIGHGVHLGYVGYDEGGQLAEAVRRKPHAVSVMSSVSSSTILRAVALHRQKRG